METRIGVWKGQVSGNRLLSYLEASRQTGWISPPPLASNNFRISCQGAGLILRLVTGGVFLSRGRQVTERQQVMALLRLKLVQVTIILLKGHVLGRVGESMKTIELIVYILLLCFIAIMCLFFPGRVQGFAIKSVSQGLTKNSFIESYIRSSSYLILV